MTVIRMNAPAGVGQEVVANEAVGAAVLGQEAAEQSEIQRLEEQSHTLLRESEIIQNLARELMEQSHGEAYREATQAREQADVMRKTAETAKGEIQSSRAQSRDGKCHLSPRKISLLGADMNVVLRLGTQEKATLEKTVAEYRTHAAASGEKESKPAPTLVQTVVRTVKHVTHGSVAAVVGTPVFAAPPILSLSGIMKRANNAAAEVSQGISHHWQRAASAVEQVADEIANTAPILRAREFGRAAWQNVQQVGSDVASGVSAFIDAPVMITRKAAHAVAQKAEMLADQARETAVEAKEAAKRLAHEYVVKPATNAAEAAVSAAKRTYQAAGEMKDKAVDAASAKLAAANLWPFGEKAAAAVAEKAKPTPSAKPKAPPAPASVTQKIEALGAMARALQQAAACRLSGGLACKAASPALLLVPAPVPNLTDFSGIATFLGA